MKSLMTHLVAGYPDLVTSKQTLKSMIDLQIVAIELQIPFSDPIADGPVLMQANDIAISNNIGISEVFDLINSDFGDTKIYLMSYLQPIMNFGIDKFFKKAKALNVSGYIIPDLPFDAPELEQILKLDSGLSESIVPVLSQGMPDDRLELLFKTLKPELVYVTARHGITGDKTASFDSSLEQFVAKVRSQTSASIALGFGIQTPDDVMKANKLADIPVVGSAITRKMEKPNEVHKLLEDLAAVARIV